MGHNWSTESMDELYTKSADALRWQSINQSINLFVQKCNTHWTGHQGRMQPPLTGAHKNNVCKSNKGQYLRDRKKSSWQKNVQIQHSPQNSTIAS